MLVEDRSQTQQTLAQGQLARATRRFERGEGTLIESSQSRTAVDLAQVRILESKDELENARRELKRLTGRDTPPHAVLSSAIMITPGCCV